MIVGIDKVDRYNGMNADDFTLIDSIGYYNHCFYKGLDGDILYAESNDDNRTDWYLCDKMDINNRIQFAESFVSENDKLDVYVAPVDIVNMNIVCGDILSTPDTRPTIICHQVNCKGVMGSGLAKQIKDKHPEVYQAYKEKCACIERGIGGLGDVQLVPILNVSVSHIIANIFGQYDYGRCKRYTDYDALKKAFGVLAKDCGQCVIRLPYGIGCGLGGGNWDIVSKIIVDELIFKGVNVEIWKRN